MKRGGRVRASRRRTWAVFAALALVVAGCGDTSSAGSGDTRRVLVDYRGDEFSASYLAYFPTDVKVHPGDSVEFKQFWTGEPHSVTMGTLVEDLGRPFWEVLDRVRSGKRIDFTEEEEPDSPEFFEQLPFLADEDLNPVQAAAQPCYLDEGGPDFSDPDEPCPRRDQPAFNGRQSYYNSGFIPYKGAAGNTFRLPIADDATPGTYHYYCNWHFVVMSGSVTIVPEGEPIPSQSEVNEAARRELDRYTTALGRVLDEARRGKRYELPVIGASLTQEESDEQGLIEGIVNEFIPSTVDARVGEKVTWTFDGGHSLAFNVPKYFPVFDVEEDRRVTLDKRGFNAVRFPGGPSESEEEAGDDDEGRESVRVDGGRFDGRGGLHSTGMGFGDGDTYSLTFTRPGTYPFACLIHPAMVGKVVVK